jgi:hypothetical protein
LSGGPMEPDGGPLGAGLPVVCAGMIGAMVAFVYCDAAVGRGMGDGMEGAGMGVGVAMVGMGIGTDMGMGMGIDVGGAPGVVGSCGLMAGDGVPAKCACGRERAGVGVAAPFAYGLGWPVGGGAGEVDVGGGVGAPGLAANAAVENGDPGCEGGPEGTCGRLAADR